MSPQPRTELHVVRRGPRCFGSKAVGRVRIEHSGGVQKIAWLAVSDQIRVTTKSLLDGFLQSHPVGSVIGSDVASGRPALPPGDAMPTKDLTFNLTADADGKVTGSHDENPPFRVRLKKVVVRSTTGCNNRTHALKAGFTGGATFEHDDQMSDCSDLAIDLGDLHAPGGTTTTLFFELSGFDPQEAVTLEGTLTYSLFG
ncbi:hypothetical protein PX52LOC_06242 [Limnoglobus roseus]|uniref:Uncharacterized protein n=1 Tax=Limnoglobus roseus TaxID=2598579 RepID=A0A5C1ALZ6_9BACT|nr:hypothetical protein PX52LOC_06242 [Limnoglobus roseus]